MAKKLPIGLQDFRTFITEGFMYIDKTKYLFELCNSGKFFFLFTSAQIRKVHYHCYLAGVIQGQSRVVQRALD